MARWRIKQAWLNIGNEHDVFGNTSAVKEVIPSDLTNDLFKIPRYILGKGNIIQEIQTDELHNAVKWNDVEKYYDNGILLYSLFFGCGGLILCMLLVFVLYFLFAPKKPSAICPERNRRLPKFNLYQKLVYLLVLISSIFVAAGIVCILLTLPRHFHMVSNEKKFMSSLNNTFLKMLNEKGNLFQITFPDEEIENVTEAMKIYLKNAEQYFDKDQVKYKAFLASVKEYRDIIISNFQNFFKKLRSIDFNAYVMQGFLWATILIFPVLILVLFKKNTFLRRVFIKYFKLPVLITIVIAWAMTTIFFIMSMRLSDFCNSNDKIEAIINFVDGFKIQKNDSTTNFFLYCYNVSFQFYDDDKWNDLNNFTLVEESIANFTIEAEKENKDAVNRPMIQKLNHIYSIINSMRIKWRNYNNTLRRTTCRMMTAAYSENLRLLCDISVKCYFLESLLAGPGSGSCLTLLLVTMLCFEKELRFVAKAIRIMPIGPKKEIKKCQNIREILRRFAHRVKTADCTKRKIGEVIQCRRQLKGKEHAYNIPLTFLNQFNRAELDKQMILDVVASMPPNYKIDKLPYSAVITPELTGALAKPSESSKSSESTESLSEEEEEEEEESSESESEGKGKRKSKR